MFSVLIFCFCVHSILGASNRILGRRNSGGLKLKELTDSEKLSQLFRIEKDGYFTDTEQIEVKPFAGINIQTEAQKLAANLRWISNEEIGVTAMQVMLQINMKIFF